MPDPVEQRMADLREKLLSLQAPIELHEHLELLQTDIAQLTQERDLYKTLFPPGHFYSPIPSLEEIQQDAERIFDNNQKEIIGIDFNEAEQLQLLDQLKGYYAELPFTEQKGTLRYFYENGLYSYSDAIFLYSMIRHLKPKNYIEVGSGFSSFVALDTNELFMENEISCTFIEPYPERLLSGLKEEDFDRIQIVSDRLQEIPASWFSDLSANDILFIDSTHVVKVGSDVNYIFSEILPRLPSGVYIHFHDIFYPFEYPQEWVYGGIAWNEVYMLRSFLQYNNAFKIVLFNTFLEQRHPDKFHTEMPLCMKNPGGSIWLKKL
jgi:hypothetical protein